MSSHRIDKALVADGSSLRAPKLSFRLSNISVCLKLNKKLCQKNTELLAAISPFASTIYESMIRGLRKKL